MHVRDANSEVVAHGHRLATRDAKLQQHLELISALPKPRQCGVMYVIEAVLAQPDRSEEKSDERNRD